MRLPQTATSFPIAIAIAFTLVCGWGPPNACAAEPPPAGVAMTLEQCRKLVVANNLAVAGQQLEWEASWRTIQAEKGIFEPDLVASGDQVRNKRQNTVEQVISQDTRYFYEKNRDYGLALEKLFSSGAKVRVGYTMQDLSNNLRTNVVDTVNHEYQGFLGVSVTQPLLRDGGFDATLSRIRLARGEADVALENWRKQLMTAIAQAEGAYWDLQQAQDLVAMREESLRIAETLLNDNRERVRAGKMSENEVLQAEAGVVLRRTYVTEARQKRVEAMDRLKTFFSEAVDATNRVVIASDLPAMAPVELDFAALARQAVARFPDYQIGLAKAAQEDVRVAYARNQRWPQLDLKGSYGLNGLGSDWDSSWEQTTDQDYESWSVGVELRVPLFGGGKGRNELAVARQRKQQALLNLRATEITLVNTLDSAITKVKAAEERAKGYRLSVDVNNKLFETERQRLEAGKSDSRKVLDVEDDLVEARVGAAESLVQYAKAVTELDFTSGMLLEKRGLEKK